MPNATFRSLCGLLSLAVVTLSGCGGDEPAPNSGASGGTPSVGGAAGQGGQQQSKGGARATATQSSAGKTFAGGSSSGLGGAATALGGSQSAVETTAQGGSQPVGGATSKATIAATGGATSKGGSTSVGGAASKGGTTSVGGTVSKGGTTSVGGVTSKGGTASVGGTTSKGGTTSAGGATSTGTTPITVWLAGDSTMQNCSSACPCGWGSQFASYFNSNVTVKNNAAGGRSIQTWMYEPNVTTTLGTDGECVITETNSTRWATTLAGMKAGDYLFIQFGINDGSATCDRHVGTARYQTLMTRMAQAALDRGAHPVLLTAVGAISCSGSTAKATRGFLTQTKAAGAALSVPVIDLHQLSTDLYNTLGFCPLPAGNTDISATTGGAVGTFFCDDHTHFDTPGAIQIAGVVAKALRQQAIALAAYLK